MLISKGQAWLAFMSTALRAVRTPEGVIIAAAIADRAAEQYDVRYGDGAFMLEGQSECATCKKPLPPGSEFTPSTDGVKFCQIACLTASGREE